MAAVSSESLPRRPLPEWNRRLRDRLQHFKGWVGEIRERRKQRAALPDAGQRKDRRKRRIVFALLLIVLAYPVLGTLALWTGLVERLVASEDLRVELDNPSYTIWPGNVHVSRARLFVNGETQFTLEGGDLVMDIAIFPLFQRRFHVTRLVAEDVRYRMRVQVDSTEGIERRLAAYPKLEGLPGANVLREDAAEQTEERDPSWTVEVDGLDVKVVELWFMEYRYLGRGTLHGGFLVGPNRMRVGTSVQDLGPGELRFGEKHVISKNFGGQIRAAIPEVNPEAHPDETFLDFVTAEVRLKGDFEDISHFAAYADGLEFSRGRGPFAARLGLNEGWLARGSEITYRTDSLRVSGRGFGVETDWDFRLDIQPDAEPPRADLPQLSSKAESTYVSLAEGRDTFTFGVHGHRQHATLKSTQIGSQLALKHAELRFPSIVTTDLDDMGALLPPAVRGKSGSAKASLRLDVDEHFVARGPARASFDDAKLSVAGVNVGGDGSARTELHLDLKRKLYELRDTNLTLAEVSMRVGDEDVDGWWANLSSPRIVVQQGPPARYEAVIGVRAKDAEPVLEALAEKDKLNDLIAKFTSLDDLRLSLTVRGADDVTDVLVRSLESDVWDVAGRVFSSKKRNQMALVIGGQAVSLGIASDGDGLELAPFAKTDWLNERLRKFPKPVETLLPSKP